MSRRGSSTRLAICEMCGREVPESSIQKVFIEGTILAVCPSCALKLIRRRPTAPQIPVIPQRTQPPLSTTPRSKPTLQPTHRTTSYSGQTRQRLQRLAESFEVVPDYAERIKRAREKLGWSQRTLAEKVRERESTIKRIESGKLKPTIDLAKRLEEVLGIKLLEPILPEDVESFRASKKSKYMPTLGEIVSIRGREEE